MAPDDDDQEYFSSDEIFEILTRTTSLKTLDACKCVSKSWKHLIYESSFLPLYCKRTKNMCGYFIQGIVRHKHRSIFVEFDDETDKVKRRSRNNGIAKFPEDMEILASCNEGLLCCLEQKHRRYRYFVCKPATQQWQPLPSPKLRYRTVGVAIMVLGSNPSLRYKVIRLSDLDTVGNYSIIRCEIFDSTIWAWRETQDNLRVPCTEIILHAHPAVRVGSSVHWLTNNNNVIAFRESDESFDIFPLPQTVRNCNDDYMAYRSKQLVDYQGRLGFTCLRPQDCVMELWLITDGPKCWTRKMDVGFSGLESIVVFFRPAGFYNAETVFVKSGSEAVFYKLQDCSVKKVELDYSMLWADQIFQFRTDLEMVDLKGGRGD